MKVSPPGQIRSLRLGALPFQKPDVQSSASVDNDRLSDFGLTGIPVPIDLEEQSVSAQLELLSCDF